MPIHTELQQMSKRNIILYILDRRLGRRVLNLNASNTLEIYCLCKMCVIKTKTYWIYGLCI